MKTLYAANLRGIVKEANEKKINKDDVVAVVKEGEWSVLVYYE